jgi:hypothetical protein
MNQQQCQQQGASTRVRKACREAALKVTISEVIPPGVLYRLPVIKVQVARTDSMILTLETSWFHFLKDETYIVVEDETMGTCERPVIISAVQYAIHLWLTGEPERTSYTVRLSAH